MRSGPRHLASRAVRSAVRFGAERIASSDRLMDVVYDLANETNFAGLAEHEEMLCDAVRIGAYHRAIHANVRPGDVVLDLGTGTGVLAFMAARAGASKVYAVDHSAFIDVAREIAVHNGITNVEFVQANAREFVPPEPVDVLLHEQMGDELFNENMVENVVAVRDRVLRPGGRVLPARFALFVEPVTFHPAMRVRRFWNIDLPDDIDLSVMERSPIAEPYRSPRAEQFWARPGSVAATVGEPSPVLELDLGSLRGIDELATRHVIERIATEDAIVDGVAVWFEARFDDATTLSTSPLGPVTSWGNRVYRVDREIARGDTIRVTVEMGRLVDPATWAITA